MIVGGDDLDTIGFEHGCMQIVSGASGSYLPIEDCKEVPTTEAKKSSPGCAYETAGGRRTVNYGQKDITILS